MTRDLGDYVSVYRRGMLTRARARLVAEANYPQPATTAPSRSFRSTGTAGDISSPCVPG